MHRRNKTIVSESSKRLTAIDGKFIILFIYFLDKDNPYQVEPLDQNKYLKTSSSINTKPDRGKNDVVKKRFGTFKSINIIDAQDDFIC